MTPDKVSGQLSGTVRTDTPFLKGCPVSGVSATENRKMEQQASRNDVADRILSGQSAALFASGDRLFILASKQDLAQIQATLIARDKQHPLELVAEVQRRAGE